MPALFDETFASDAIHSVPSKRPPILSLSSSSNEIELESTDSANSHQEHLESLEVDNLALQGESENEPDLPRPTKPAPIIVTDLFKISRNSASSPLLNSAREFEESQMGRKSRQSPSQESDRTASTASGGLNGHPNGNMDSRFEMRRKNPSLDFPTAASQTAHLMSREDFTLDDEPPPTPHTPNSNASFFQLPRKDRRNFLLLVLLYFLQGIPTGLAGGSVPFLLKKHLSYGQIGVFSLASYPYSLKLLWSPIVDAVWHPKLGRRKSWILPIQMCSGFSMIYLGGKIKEMIVTAEASDGSGVWTFTWWWFFLVFLCATQDIAVDGEQALRLLKASADMRIRMGSYTNLSTKPLVRLNRSDGWAYCRPLSFIHGFPGS